MKFDFKSHVWNMISPEGKDFISKILVPAEERLTALQALQHPWMGMISNNDASPSLLKNTVLQLKNFRADRQLQRAVLTFITS